MNQPKISVIVVYKNETNLQVSLNILLRQSFSDTEIICVSNGADEAAQKIVQDTALNEDKIKLINLPASTDENMARQVGLGIAGGEFVCFINPEEIQGIDFIKNLYNSSVVFKKFDFKENHLYRRSFLENDENIIDIIKNSVKNELNNSQHILNEQKSEIKNLFDKFYQTNLETIKNSNYDVLCRFNQLEKLFYEKDFQNSRKVQDILKESQEKYDNSMKQIYEDISKVYEHITSEINKKGSEINAVYEGITKNYHYTEQLITETNNENMKITDDYKESIWKKLNELEKEIITRYVNIKRLLDMRFDELQTAGEGENVPCLSDTLSENLDKIYQRLDESSSFFYKELSKIYKDLNEELIRKSDENKYNTEKKIEELRNEFSAELKKLKEELSK